MRNPFQITIPIQVKASLAVLSAQLCFSGWHIVGSVAFRGGTDPFVFILYRLIIGTALMHVYIKVYRMNTFIDPLDHHRMFAAGMLSFLNVICGSLSLKFIAPSRFAIFQPCIPCIVTAISMLFRLEQMSRTKLLGIALAVAGAFTAELWKDGNNHSHVQEESVPVGVFFATTQVFAMGSLLVVVKPLLNKYEPAVVSGMYFIVSTAAIIMVVICRIDTIPLADFAFNGHALAWLAVMYVAVFATLYSFSAINWGGKFLPPTVTTVFFTFQPVGTIFLSATLLGAGVTVPEALGGLLIICGLVVTSLAQSRSAAVTVVEVGSTHSSAGSDEGTVEFSVLHSHNIVESDFKPRSRSVTSTGSASYNPLVNELSYGGGTSSGSGAGGGVGNNGSGRCSGGGAGSMSEGAAMLGDSTGKYKAEVTNEPDLNMVSV